jgi:lactam utilization protein B
MLDAIAVAEHSGGKRRLQADAVGVHADFAEAMRSLIPNKQRLKWSDVKIAKKE